MNDDPTDPEPDDGDAALSPTDRLSLRIGRVARADVELELSMRYLYQALCGISAAVVLVPPSFEPLLQAVRTLVGYTILSDEWRDAAVSTLDAAASAHGERNRVVHDRWLPELGEDGVPAAETWQRERAVKNAPHWTVSRKTLGELDATTIALRRASIRCAALTFATSDRLHGHVEAERDAHWLRTAEDRFELRSDGSYVVLDD